MKSLPAICPACAGARVASGVKHAWYRNPDSGVYQAVARYREINQYLAEQIIKRLSE